MAGEADAAAAAAAATAATEATAAAAAQQTAWTKDVPPEIMSKWTDKKYPLTDPKTVAIEATRAYLSAESLIGGDPNLMIRLPKTPAEAGWDKVWAKLGAPDKPEGYDFSAVKGADGKPLAPALADALRKVSFDTHIPKDAAVTLAQTVLQQREAEATAANATKQATLLAQKEALKTAWGEKTFDAKLFKAKEAAGALKVTKEQLDSLQEVIGYDGVMNMFLTIGTKIGEDKFQDGNPLSDNPNLMTKEQAQTKLAALKKDKAWGLRLLSGDTAALAESKALAAIIAGDDTDDSKRRAGR